MNLLPIIKRCKSQAKKIIKLVELRYQTITLLVTSIALFISIFFSIKSLKTSRDALDFAKFQSAAQKKGDSINLHKQDSSHKLQEKKSDSIHRDDLFRLAKADSIQHRRDSIQNSLEKLQIEAQQKQAKVLSLQFEAQKKQNSWQLYQDRPIFGIVDLVQDDTRKSLDGNPYWEFFITNIGKRAAFVDSTLVLAMDLDGIKTYGNAGISKILLTTGGRLQAGLFEPLKIEQSVATIYYLKIIYHDGIRKVNSRFFTLTKRGTSFSIATIPLEQEAMLISLMSQSNNPKIKYEPSSDTVL